MKKKLFFSFVSWYNYIPIHRHLKIALAAITFILLSVNNLSAQSGWYIPDDVAAPGTPMIFSATPVAGYTYANQICAQDRADNDPFCVNGDWDGLCQNAYEGCITPGCMDPTACNFDSTANEDDGSCELPQWYIPIDVAATNTPMISSCDPVAGYYLANQACAQARVDNDPYCVNIDYDSICDDAYQACAPNELCFDADPVECGMPVQGNTVGAPDVTGIPYCGTSDSGSAGGLWYSFIAPADGDYKITTCSHYSDFTDYDTKVRVYSGTCDALVCVGGDDDEFADPLCDHSGFHSMATVTLTAGEEYLIVVYGYNDYEGNFELLVTPVIPFTIECPAYVNLGCDDSISPDDLGYPVVTDNGCNMGLVFSYDDELNCDNGDKYYTRHWTVMDTISMYSATCDQFFGVFGDAEFTSPTPDLVLQCGDPAPPLPTVNNCAGPVTYVDYNDHTPWLSGAIGGIVDLTGLPSTIVLTDTSDTFSVEAALTTVKATTLSFHYEVTINDIGEQEFGYFINDTFTTLYASNDNGTSLSGDVSVNLASGDNFTFISANLGAVTTTEVLISNITFDYAELVCPVVDCYIRQYSADKLCQDGTIFRNQLITVEDNDAPVVGCDDFIYDFEGCPDDLGVNTSTGVWTPIGNDGGFFGVAGGSYFHFIDLSGCVSDNCTDLADIEFSFIDSYLEDYVAGCTVTIVNEAQVRDACGNISQNHIILRYTIHDVNAPTIDVEAENSTVECDGTTDAFDAWLASNGGAEASDSCSTVTWSNSCESPMPDGSMVFDCQFENGNSGQIVFGAANGTSNGYDTFPNGIAYVNGELVLVSTFMLTFNSNTSLWEVSESGNPLWTSAVDSSSPSCDFTDWDDYSTTCSISAVTCYNQSTSTCDFVGDGCNQSVTVLFTATDACGNKATTEATFTYEDHTAPELVTTNDSIATHECTTYDVLNLMAFADQYAGGATLPEIIASDAFQDYKDSIYAQHYAQLAPVSNIDACDNGAHIVFDNLTFAYSSFLPGGTIEPDSLGNCDLRAIFTLEYHSEDDCGNATDSHFVSIEAYDYEAPEITLFPEDITIECSALIDQSEAGVLAYLLAAYDASDVSYQDNCVPFEAIPLDVQANLGLISVDITSDFSDPCHSWCAKTLTVTDGCRSVSQTFTVTIIDTQAPEFPYFEDTLTVQCLEEVPAPLDLTAEDCWATVDGTSFGSNVSEIISQCTLTDALGGTDDWAIWLPLLADSGLVSSPNFVWDANGGHFDCYADSTAHLYGIVVNDSNPNEKFEVHLWFEEKSDWTTWSAAGHLAKDPLNTCTDDHVNWDYWKLVGSISHLSGLGDLADSDLSFYHDPADYTFGFQVGNGANTKNCNFGMSGWFTYDGLLVNQGERNKVVGNGDVNVDADCQDIVQEHCDNFTKFKYSYVARDTCWNTARACQIIFVHDTTPPTFTYVAADTTILCNEWPLPVDSAMATDNCMGEVVITMLQDSLGGTCPNEFTITRTWRATDMCDNYVDSAQIIHVVDTVAPVMTGLPPADGSPCGNDAGNYELCYSMNNANEVWSYCPDTPGDGTMMSVTFDSGYIETTYDHLYVYDNDDGTGTPITDIQGTIPPGTTFTATNPSGCLTFNLTTDGTWTCESQGWEHLFYEVSCANPATSSNIEVQCDSIPEVPEVTATDNCSQNVEPVFTETSTIDQDGHCDYTITRTWTSTDECGNSSEFVQTIHVIDTNPPVFDPYELQVQVECDEVMDFTITAQDCNLDTITYTQVWGSWGCSLGSYTRTYTATDSCGNSATAVQYINIIDTHAPELLGVPADSTIECSDMPTPVDGNYFDLGGVTAMDACMGEMTVTYWEDSLPGACPDAFTLTRYWTSKDSCQNADTAMQVITILDTTPPVWTSFPDDLDLDCSETMPTSNVVATDNCDLDVAITMTADTTLGNCAGNYVITRTFTAEDNCGNAIDSTQTITVTDTTGPEFTYVPMDYTYECTDTIPDSMATAMDDCSGPAILSFEDYTEMTPWRITGNTGTVDLSGVPSAIQLTSGDDAIAGRIMTFTTVKAMTISFDWDYSTNDVDGPSYDKFKYRINGVNTLVTNNNGNNTQSGHLDISLNAGDNFALLARTTDGLLGSAVIDVTNISVALTPLQCPIIGCFIREFTAVDQCGNESYATQFITIEDTTPPVFDPFLPEIDMPCDQVDTTITVTATDACPTVFIIFHDDNQVSGGCAGNIIRTYIAEDSCGNKDSIEQIIHLYDSIAPVFIDFPVDTSYQCITDLPLPAMVTGEDNCDTIPTIEYIGETQMGSCPTTVTRTWSITDHCNNTTEQSQTIIINDTIAPVFDDASFPADQELSCGVDIPLMEPLVTDNCTTTPSLSHEDVSVGEGCTVIVTRTWTVTDECGNSVARDQVFTIIDDVAPVFTFIPESMALDCQDSIPTTEATAEDACNNGVTITHEDVIDGNSAHCYTLTRTWTATDSCGNANVSTVQTVYTVTDSQAPVFDQTVEDVTVQCEGDAPAVEVVTATDNCDTAVNVQVDVLLLSTDSCGNSQTLITYTAVDSCGNAADPMSYTITVEDTLPPVIEGAPDDVTITCNDEVPAPFDGVTATDNCDNDVTVEMTETIIGHAPTPGSLSDCALETGPNDHEDPDWSLKFTSNWPTNDVYYTTTSAYFVEMPGGIAHLYGHVESVLTGGGWDIDVMFDSGMDWTMWSALLDLNGYPRDYKDSYNEAGLNYLDWTYYIMTAGDASLTGTGDYTGSLLNLTHAPSNLRFGYQVGVAANNVNTNFGNGGWFFYAGNLVTNEGTPQYVQGAGDFAFDADCCLQYQIVRTYTATDCSGNSASVQYTIDVVAGDAVIEGCTDSMACNYDSAATTDDSSCTYPGCTDITASNFDSTAGCDDGSCTYDPIPGCTIADACNYNPAATENDGSCDFGLWYIPEVPGTGEALQSCNGAPAGYIEGDQTCIEQVINDPYCVNNEWDQVCQDAYDACIGTGTEFDFTYLPESPITIECSSDYYDEPEAESVCGNYEIQFVDEYISDDGCTAVFDRIFTLVDDCGNELSYTQEITTVDTTPPVFEGENAEGTFECNLLPLIVPPMITDNCDEDPFIVTDVEVIDGDCAGERTEILSFVAFDACGNASEPWVFTAHYVDTTPPIIELEGFVDEMTLECGDELPYLPPTAFDYCSEVTIDYADEIDDTDPCTTYILRTWLVTDGCGNQSGVEQSFIMVDTTPPVFGTPPVAEIVIACGDAIPDPSPDVSWYDNCSSATVVINEYTEALGGCEEIIHRDWVITDACGNSTIFNQTISVVDGAGIANDECSGAITLNFDQLTNVDNTGATGGLLTPDNWFIGDGEDNSVWYSFTTPDVVEFIKIQTYTDGYDNPFDTQLAVYEACGDAVEIASNDDGGNGLYSKIEFDCGTLAPNTTYYIVVDGYDGDQGSCNIIITQTGCGMTASLQLNLTAYLGGPLNPETYEMNDYIRTEPSFPLTEPYTELGYEHVNGGGGEQTRVEVLAVEGSDAIVDWVVVELRSANNPAVRLATKSALIQRDGDIVSSSDGTSLLSFEKPDESFLIVIRHRNHLGVCNLDPIAISQEGDQIITLDFTDPNLPVMGGEFAMGMEGNKRVFYAGDANNDGSVNPVDKNNYWRVENGASYDYFNSSSDFNLDGSINPFDKNAKWRVNNGKSEQIDNN